MSALPGWPALPLSEWSDTCETLHRVSQMLGKVTLATTPRVNHFWNVTLRVTARGLATPLLRYAGGTLEMELDFLADVLRVRTGDGRERTLPLGPRSVADLHRELFATLHALGIECRIWRMPVEIPDPIPFDRDEVHRAYDGDAARRFARVLASAQDVFTRFRAEFLGKCSPVHFFWGSFDLAVTRFSGRKAPERPGADAVTREAYSHEVSSVGFWPGDARLPHASFYCYAAPEPEGFRAASVSPAAAYYNEALGGFYLHYDDLRSAPDPDAALLDFCRTTYAAAADLGKWDRAALERRG